MDKHARPSESPETRKFITEAFRKHLWNYAQNMYGIKATEREKVLDLVQIMNTLMEENYNLEELEEGLHAACAKSVDRGFYKMPTPIAILQEVKQYYRSHSRPEQKSDSKIEEATEQTSRREQFKKDFFKCLDKDTAKALIHEYCQINNLAYSISFNREDFFADFFRQDSSAKAIIVDYGIDIRKTSGERYT